MKVRPLFSLFLCLLLFPCALATPPQEKPVVPQNPTKSLKVKVTYKGAGKVDKNHGIHLFLFDTPDFAQNPAASMPIGMLTAYSSGEALTFAGLTAPAVYLAGAYNEDGSYDPPNGPPPPGTPVAVYLPTDPQGPTPIKLSQTGTTEIEFAFGDEIRMPEPPPAPQPNRPPGEEL